MVSFRNMAFGSLSFRSKTIIGVAIIEALLLLIIIVKSVMYLQDPNASQFMERANTTVNLSVSMSKDAVLSFDLASIETFLDEILENRSIVYARIIGMQEQVLGEKVRPTPLLLRNYSGPG